jgi:hypothetical protein
MNSDAATVSDEWPVQHAAVGRDIVLGSGHSASSVARDAGGADTRNTFVCAKQVPVPRHALVRYGREIVDFIMVASPDDLQQRFLRDVAYAAAEAVATNDLWPVAELLQGWEADAEISQDQELAASVNEAIGQYRAGDKGRPWEEVARELGIDGESVT